MRGRGWGPPPGRRPPWWPEGEPFPPRRWGRRGPPPFVRRLGCFLFAIPSAAVLVGTVIGGLVAQLGGLPVAVLAILLFALLLAVSASAPRRHARPLDHPN